LRDLLDRVPFAPFRLTRLSGQHYDVVDPRTAVVMNSQIFVAFPDGEHWTLIPLGQLSEVEMIAKVRKKRIRSNGDS
jgi:hypothetical protein